MRSTTSPLFPASKIGLPIFESALELVFPAFSYGGMAIAHKGTDVGWTAI